MKEALTTSIVLLLLLLPALLRGQEKKAERPDTIKISTIEVKGMKCTSCVAAVERALTAVEGVESVQVDLEKKHAVVRYLPAQVQVASLERAIANAGYNANKVKRNEDAYGQLPSCCK
jgi:periplasmic mercuric ion binding protein